MSHAINTLNVKQLEIENLEIFLEKLFITFSILHIEEINEVTIK